MAEPITERHNRVVNELVQRIIADFPDQLDRLIVLESMMVGIIAGMPFKSPRMGGVNETLRTLSTGVAQRVLDYYRKQEQTP